MNQKVNLDGVPCVVERLGDGTLRVWHQSVQVNAVNGHGTAGEVMYLVHPSQRNQYEYLVSLLPQAHEVVDPSKVVRPWWSYAGGSKEKRDRNDAE